MSISRTAAIGVLALGLSLTMPARAGLADGLDKIGSNLQKLRSGLAEGLAKTGAQLGQGLGKGLEQIGGALDGSLEQSLDALAAGLTRLGQRYVAPIDGAVVTYDAVEFQGVGRSLIVIAPQVASPELAPVIVLLHFSNGNAELMANLTRAGRLAAEHGAWIVLPDATNRRWGDDPATAPSGSDVEFLAKLIAHVTSAYPLDPKRVYMAGMSNGGFMTERFACERPELLAAAAVDAATLRKSLDRVCAPSRAVPIVHFAGTRDPYVPYTYPLAMLPAQDTYARWSAIHGCDPASRQDARPAPQVADGTSIEISENWDCSSGGAVRLYTIVGGGHAWPGASPVVPIPLGRTTQNLDATEAMWDFMSLFTL